MLITVTQAAVFIISTVAAFAHKDLPSCNSSITCPCGKTGRNITVCDERLEDPCKKWTLCTKCKEGINRCLECADGFIGPWCTDGSSIFKVRRKRQNIIFREETPRNRYRPKQPRRSTSTTPQTLLSCPRIRNPTNGNVNCEYRGNERVCIAKCISGFTFRGRGPDDEIESKCIAGTWTPFRYFPTCELNADTVSCPDPGRIRNGNRSPNSSPSGNTFSWGSTIEYSCNSGYDMKGQKSIICLQDGKWSSALPECVAENRNDSVNCKNPGFISNGNMMQLIPMSSGRSRTRAVAEDVDQFPQGAQIEYSCDDGFRLQGSARITCEKEGSWSSSSPMCLGDCGRSLTFVSRRITHGQPTVAGDWPWVVAITIQVNNAERLICSGALVTSRTVVTAAHCLAVSNSFTLYFGKIYRKNNNDDSEVNVRKSSRIISHPNFNATSFDSDIGIITFQPRVKFGLRIQPICLPTADAAARNLMTGSFGEVTGWGITEKKLQSNVLLLARLPIHSNRDCIESFKNQNISMNLNDNMFCAGYENGQQSVCRGDSGSPLVFSDNSLKKRYTLEGIVSFSARGECGIPGRYTVFTKVYKFLSWIMRNLS